MRPDTLRTDRPPPPQRKGSPVARKRPAASDVEHPVLIGLDGGKLPRDPTMPSRAEARALRRREAVTYAQLRRHLTGVPDPPLREV